MEGAVGPEARLGEWTGKSQTWFDPKGKAMQGEHKGRFTRVVGGLYIEEDYEGYIDEKRHEGKRIWGFQGDRLSCYWIDSFHTGPKPIVFEGGREGEAHFVRGSYEVKGQTFGWRIEISTQDKDLLIKHFNIWPSGQVDLAVETRLTR